MAVSPYAAKQRVSAAAEKVAKFMLKVVND
jgi:hypothetical protein